MRLQAKKSIAFFKVEAVADVESLDGNHSDDGREYFGRNVGFLRETYADYGSMRPTILLFAPGVNYPILFLGRSGSRIYLPLRLVGKVSRSSEKDASARLDPRLQI